MKVKRWSVVSNFEDISIVMQRELWSIDHEIKAQRLVGSNRPPSERHSDVVKKTWHIRLYLQESLRSPTMHHDSGEIESGLRRQHRSRDPSASIKNQED